MTTENPNDRLLTRQEMLEVSLPYRYPFVAVQDVIKAACVDQDVKTAARVREETARVEELPVLTGQPFPR